MIAVPLVRVVQVTLDEIVRVIGMRNRLMTTGR